MEYYVIGERELVLAFGLVGVKGQVAANRSDALDAFNRVTGKGGAAGAPVEADRPRVLILTEEVSSLLDKEIVDWQMKGNYPLIVEIPGLQGHLKGKKTLTDSIREAIGIQV